MSNVNRTLAILLSILFFVSVIGILASCKDDIDEEKKYDVAVMIMRREVNQQLPTGERWIVDADTHTADIEQLYDGKSYVYYVYAYNLPDHPEFYDIWFLYNRKSKFSFQCTSYIQRREYNNGYLASDVLYSSVCEIGEYTMSIYPSKESQLWNDRKIELRITVK